MVTRSHVFAPGEWYHCYSRGVEKRRVFEDSADYKRFTGLLYLANAQPTLHRSDYLTRSLNDILTLPRDETITAIGAWCLMPNHIHLLLKEKEEGGISTFMLKLMTSYSMYFNKRYEHEGSLFTRPFRSRHVNEDRYFQHIVDYIHLNPAELFERGWKRGDIKNPRGLRRRLTDYPFSSLGDFGDERATRVIIDSSIFNAYTQKPVRKMIENAGEYYETHTVKGSP